MIDFLKTWGALGIATIALVQPWALALWKSVFRRGRVDIHHAGQIEIGYYPMGPMLTLRGSLRAIYKDAFVEAISAEVTKLKDSSVHTLAWRELNARLVSLSMITILQSDQPSGFMLNTNAAYPYRIGFVDGGVAGEIRTVMERVQDEWSKGLKDSSAAGSSEGGTQLSSAVGRIRVERDEALRRYKGTNGYRANARTLDRLCYWDPGKYELRMSVHTTRPERVFRRMWWFELSEEEARELAANTEKMMEEACGASGRQYDQVVVEYRAG